MRKIEEDRYIIETDYRYMQIKGTLDSPSCEEILDNLFQNIHEEILSKEIEEIIIDITELSYMTAPAICEFADWILNIETLDPAKKYSISFICDTDRHLWQESTFSTLVSINPSIVKKESI